MFVVLLAGLSGCGTPAEAPPPPVVPVPVVAPAPPPKPVEPPGPVDLQATIESISAADMVVDGHTIVIDANTVFDGFGEAAPAVGDAVAVHGMRGGDGTVVATKITGNGAKAAPPPPGVEEE